MLEGLTTTRVAFARTVRLVTTARLRQSVMAGLVDTEEEFAALAELEGASRGAWYAALETQTCLREVIFHMTEFLANDGDFNATVDYGELYASLAGEYLDLRPHPDHPSLHRDTAIGYPAGNALADAARAKGLNGIIYSPIRHSGGTCIAALWPHAVQSVAPGDVIRLTWRGERTPRVERGVAEDI
jgi:hypothetical protein